MAPEKRMSIAFIPIETLPKPVLHVQRKTMLMGLCGIAILTTGIAIGLGLSIFCGASMGEFVRAIAYSNPQLSLDEQLANIGARDLVGNNTNTIIGVVTATRPNKFFGPTISPQLAQIIKATNHLASIERRSADEIDEASYDILEERATVTNAVMWQPGPGLNWTYQLSQVPSSTQLKNAAQYNVWDIDMFDTPASSIQTIHAAGSKVICYFSGGTDENWRSDSNQFLPSDIGQPMGDWPGENWINTKSTNVRRIMANRLDLAKSKGCDGVDPDNIDAYNHNTGFPLTQSDAVNYITYLAKQAAMRGLAISLKNSADIIPKVINLVQYSVEEACSEYDECDLYQPFTNAGKPVFHVEYPKGYGTVNTATVASSSMAAICTCQHSYKLSPIVKNNNLDSWQQQCA